jgi:glutamate synthase domain-containing protein 1/glutamate synthase domain-containing protein 3
MEPWQLAETLIASARRLGTVEIPRRKAEAEGGCGVIGLASSEPLPGRALLQPLAQMRNRGNGKGGGVAAAGLDPGWFGVPEHLLREDYLLAVAYLDTSARRAVETEVIEPTFDVHEVRELQPAGADGYAVPPPEVRCYLARVRADTLGGFMREHRIPDDHRQAAEDEAVSQAGFRLNQAFYAATGEKRAFVLSQGRDLLVLKLVGYGDDVVRCYGLENLRAHIWIGHHRYPTKGLIWHPGGAHPFAGLQEALVHNGDFANYASICSYLAQHGRFPLFVTDTEVAVLLFDLLHRVRGYPLELVIEALAPTTERDFALLPTDRQRLYRLLQIAHIHGSPDGPWFFLLAQSLPDLRACRLIGITDTSMLRPQVFALQRGEVTIGVAASEKQAIDALLEGLACEDARFWGRADRYWSARGGSHTDGGAFMFTARMDTRELECTDKFGRPIQVELLIGPLASAAIRRSAEGEALARRDLPAASLFESVCQGLPRWDEAELGAFLEELCRQATSDSGRERAIGVITQLMDRRYPLGGMKRSRLLAALDPALDRVMQRIRDAPSPRHRWALPDAAHSGDPEAVLVFDARSFGVEGERSLSRALVEAYHGGARRLVVVGARGHRFLGCGLGPRSEGLRIDVYGAAGDYLASGIDGAQIVVHGSAQDQVAQIMKEGRLVVHGDVGQTFMYAAKGGQAFVLGSAAGRPLINAVGRTRVIINGTCLDYLAESFMAGDPLNDGGFAVLNGIELDEAGGLHELSTPYAGGNLFSLASGGAIYIRDPKGTLSEDQLNGGELTELSPQDWGVVLSLLEENERLFGIPLERLLTVGGRKLPPDHVYRKVRPAEHTALAPEEAWVKQQA